LVRSALLPIPALPPPLPRTTYRKSKNNEEGEGRRREQKGEEKYKDNKKKGGKEKMEKKEKIHKEGRGVETAVLGSVYGGEWKGDKREGKGTLTTGL
jgi:hypothetical protein